MRKADRALGGRGEKLRDVRDRTGVKIGEAFMVRTHPQWLRRANWFASGRIGDLRTIIGLFSYFNRDPANIRNIAESAAAD